jgi:tetratricopeptide (TPR) repeat protein
MGRVEKNVFISYRRTNLPWALNIFHNLTSHGYDVFFDYESIPSGDFEQLILSNIRARAHFLVVLTPSALERCVDPEDWLRREIETALDEKRNIVPLFLEGFNFGTLSISSQLTGKLAQLKNYNGLNIPVDYFTEAMERLRNRYLNVALGAVLHPVSATIQKEVQKQQAAASIAPEIKEKELGAQEWFEQAHKNWVDNNFDEAIHCATEAILLKTDFPEAYSRRGTAVAGKGDLDGAIKDFTEAIRLKPDFVRAYYNRGVAHSRKGDLDGAIKDYTEIIRLNPDDAEAYNSRGSARSKKDDLDGAIKDYTEAIRLKPDFADPYHNRGATHLRKGDLDGAVKDYTEAIRLKPDFALAYYNRARIWNQKEDYYAAVADFQKYLDMGGTNERARQYLNDAKKKIGK